MSATNTNNISEDTFIPYNTQSVQKKKRLRENKSDTGPTKKKLATTPKRKQTTPATKIWIGACVNETQGAFCVYRDNNEYKTDIFGRENEFQDIDYAYALGTLRTLEEHADSSIPIMIMASSSILTEAIFKGLLLEYYEISEKIRNVIESRGLNVKVKYVSPSNEQCALAMRLATLALYSEEDEEEGEELSDLEVRENQSVIEPAAESIVEKEVKHTEEVLKEESTTKVTSTDDTLKQIVENINDVEKIEEAVEMAIIARNPSSKVIIETTVETIVETKVAVRVIEADNQPMVMEQVEEVAVPGSWFNIKSIFSALSTPFRARKSSQDK